MIDTFAHLASTRRDLLKGGGALVIGFSLGVPLAAQIAPALARRETAGPPDPNMIDSYIVVHAENTATVFLGKTELGQGNTTGLLQIAAEELDLDMHPPRCLKLDRMIGRRKEKCSLAHAGAARIAVGPQPRSDALSTGAARVSTTPSAPVFARDRCDATARRIARRNPLQNGSSLYHYWNQCQNWYSNRGKRMKGIRKAWTAAAGVVAAVAISLHALPARAADKVLTITSQSTITMVNPYGESETQMYFVWCQIYGCLGRLDYMEKKYSGMLAEKWEVINPTTWRFTLRRDLKRHDGGPGPTARDVVHSWKRIMTDPDSAQRFMMFEIKEIVAVDDYTFDIVTLKPTGQVVSDLFSQFAITSAELYEKYGKDADKTHPFGWGPYKLDDFAVDNRIVLKKSDLWPEKRPQAPDVVVYRQMREPEQRVTAVLNNEVQVARLIPPQLIARLTNRSEVKVVETGSVELMFLAFSPVVKPWDDVRVRKAAAYAINRDVIIKRLLLGHADQLEGALGPNQICYAGPSKAAIGYDPQKAKALLAEAGYKNGGPEVEFYTSTGRYISDRQVSEAMAQMLSQVGFKVRLVTPEWANLWADVRNGKVPMYYMGRGQVADPSIALSQYFETGISPRIKYSNAEVDAMFEKVRSTFDPEERCKHIREVVDKIATDVPAHFLWAHRLINAARANVTWPADPTGEAWLLDVKMQ